MKQYLLYVDPMLLTSHLIKGDNIRCLPKHTIDSIFLLPQKVVATDTYSNTCLNMYVQSLIHRNIIYIRSFIKAIDSEISCFGLFCRSTCHHITWCPVSPSTDYLDCLIFHIFLITKSLKLLEERVLLWIFL